jgi:hypothetical protein
MSPSLRILGIHGLGDHRRSNWAEDWRAAIASKLNPEQRAALKFIPFCFDQFFERVRVTPDEAWRAFRKLVRSGFGQTGRTELIQESTRWLRWYAGYVVAWLEDVEFRRNVGSALCDTLTAVQPDIVAAHSLGSLISYDALRRLENTAATCEPAGLVYVTLGSQLGNPFVSGNLVGGRVRPLPVRRWFHLYNPHDDVFAAPLAFEGSDHFEQIVTPFNLDGWADHDAVAYLSHPEAVRRLWSRLGEVLAAA